MFVQINHLSDGMKIGLTDKVEKHSDALGRDAVFSLQSRIKRLPRYLCIQVKKRRCFLARATVLLRVLLGSLFLGVGSISSLAYNVLSVVFCYCCMCVLG